MTPQKRLLPSRINRLRLFSLMSWMTCNLYIFCFMRKNDNISMRQKYPKDWMQLLAIISAAEPIPPSPSQK